MLFDLSDRRINFNASSVVFEVSEPCPDKKPNDKNQITNYLYKEAA